MAFTRSTIYYLLAMLRIDAAFAFSIMFTINSYLYSLALTPSHDHIENEMTKFGLLLMT